MRLCCQEPLSMNYADCSNCVIMVSNLVLWFQMCCYTFTCVVTISAVLLCCQLCCYDLNCVVRANLVAMHGTSAGQMQSGSVAMPGVIRNSSTRPDSYSMGAMQPPSQITTHSTLSHGGQPLVSQTAIKANVCLLNIGRASRRVHARNDGMLAFRQSGDDINVSIVFFRRSRPPPSKRSWATSSTASTRAGQHTKDSTRGPTSPHWALTP